MNHKIETDDWQIIKEQIKKYERLQKKLSESCIPPKKEDAEQWSEEQGEILEIIQAIRDKQNICTYILFHDEVAPLADVADHTEILPYKLEGPPEEVEKIIKRLKRDTQRVLWVLHEMEFWSPEAELLLKSVNIKDLVTEITPWLEGQFKKHWRSKNFAIKIEDEFSGLIHEPILAMLLLNIATNAGMHGKGDTLEIFIKRNGKNGVIEISDNGIGIDPERVTTIFDWDSEKQGEKGGIGLGRAQEKMAIMNGTISCEPHGGLPDNHGNHGAKFTLTFPLSENLI